MNLLELFQSNEKFKKEQKIIKISNDVKVILKHHKFLHISSILFIKHLSLFL